MSAAWRRVQVPALVLLVLNLLVFVAFTLPRTVAFRNLAVTKSTLEAEVQREQKRVDALRQRAERAEANVRDRKRFLQEYTPDRRSQLVPILQELRSTASELGLRLDRQGYNRSPVPGLPVTRFEITLPVTGTYAQLGAFLDRLERSPRFITIDRVSLRESGARGGNASLDVKLSVFFRRDAEDDAEFSKG